MLISVHIPKTAGVSFLNAIETQFEGRLLRDYADMPLNNTPAQRNLTALRDCMRNAATGSKFKQIQCIHGHFLPLKYRFLPTTDKKQFVIWIRDPVERLASHFHYWNREYDAQTAGTLHRRVVEEAWTLERFCLGLEMRNTYSKFLWGFPLDRFDFIGSTEHYSEDLLRFGQMFTGVDLLPSQDNANPESAGTRYVEDLDLRGSIEAHHAADMRLYRRALQLREERQERTRGSEE